jgi:uncharacterized protein
MSSGKPLPIIDADSRLFWNGCREHQLRFQKCEDCGWVRWPASGVCPECFSQNTVWITANGKGRVYTFVVYHVAFHPGFENDIPYVVAMVELEEGPRLLTNLVGCHPEEVRCDLAVEVTWEEVTAEFTLPMFRPAR